MAVGWSLDQVFPLPHAADNSQHEIDPDHLHHGYENCPEHSDYLPVKRIAESSMLGPQISAFLGKQSPCHLARKYFFPEERRRG